MSCSIHTIVEQEINGKWVATARDLLAEQSYRVFGFLGNVRNYAGTPFLSDCRGIPEDISEDTRQRIEDSGADGHSHSWLALNELLLFDYDAIVEDRRCTVKLGPNFFDGAGTAPEGEGVKMTWRLFLGGAFAGDLVLLRLSPDPSNSRLIFWFDN